jgi:lysophospholipase L1-like esterase
LPPASGRAILLAIMKSLWLSLLGTLCWPVWLTMAAPDTATEPPVLSTAATKALPQLDQAAAPVAHGFTIFLIGDSTMANKPLMPDNPERGWGQMLGIYFQAGVRVENHALNGRSSKSFRDEGQWATVQRRIKPGDWVIIQFGHNDEKDQDPTRYTKPGGTFNANLARYVAETRALGANPLLATPVARRKFDAQGQPVNTHGDYVKAVREVAAAENVPLLDLNQQSTDLLRRMGPEASKRLYIYVTPGEYGSLPQGRQDDTHFCAFGASRMCDLAVAEIQAKAPELACFLNAPHANGAK